MKFKIFDFFQISLVILAKFLLKIGGRGEGVKRPPIGLKFFLGTFYDICAQKKKEERNSQKNYIFATPVLTPQHRHPTQTPNTDTASSLTAKGGRS